MHILRSTVMVNDGVRHYQMSTIWTVAGIAWGAISYSYSASIIGTTLGIPILA